MLGLGNSIISGVVSSELTQPSDIANLAIWYKNATGIASADDGSGNILVSQWNDSSGNGRHAVQGTATAQPAVSAGTGLTGGIDLSDAGSVNARDHMDITESSAYVDIGSTNAFTFVGVIRREGAASEKHALLGGVGSNNKFQIETEEKLVFKTVGTTVVESTFVFPTDTWEKDELISIVVTKNTSGVFKFYKNGGSAMNGDESGSSNLTNVGTDFDVRYLAANFDGSAVNDRHFDGKILEVMLYSSELTAGNISDINAYIASKFTLGS